MSVDVSAEVAGMISGAKVFGSSENIRHGRYRFVIRRIHAQKVETEKGLHNMAFWEVTPIRSEPNPQTEGDRVDYISAASPGVGPLRDDGMNPNKVGSLAAMKVDFDGPGGRSAGANIQEAILALFGKRPGEVSDAELNKTWLDLSRTKPLKKGDPIGVDQATGKVIYATEDKNANPACGMVIDCVTMAKKKRTPNDKGAYITKLVWMCVSPPGVGENAPELVAKRRAEIETSFADEEEETSSPPPPANGNVFQGGAPVGAGASPMVQAIFAPPAATLASPVVQQSAAPLVPPPPAPPAAPAAPAAFEVRPPWVPHPSQPAGPTPETRWYWSNPALGGNNAVKNEADLRAGQ